MDDRVRKEVPGAGTPDRALVDSDCSGLSLTGCGFVLDALDDRLVKKQYRRPRGKLPVAGCVIHSDGRVAVASSRFRAGLP